MNRGIRLPLLLVVVATASLIQFVLARPDPTGRWPFGEGTGTNLQMNAGLSAESELTSFAAGRSTRSSELTTTGQAALQFDGVQNYASVPHNDALTPQGPFTVECWVLFVDIAHFFVGNMDASQENGWFLGLSDPDNTLYVDTGFSSYGNAQIFGVTPVNDGAWHHVAGVYDGTNLVLYVDGVPEAELEIGEDTLVMNGQSLWFGGLEGFNSYYPAVIDEVRISNAARYTAEFDPVTSFVVDTNTIAYWKFNESNGSVAADETTNHFDATLYGDSPPQWVDGVTDSSIDTIGDGIPNWWRQRYFGSGTTTNSDSCATCDYDRDGYSNLQEYFFGTDPTDLNSHPDVPAGLVLWWKMDEGSGTTVADASGNGHNGSLQTTWSSLPTWTNGVVSGAVNCYGDQNYVGSDYPISQTFTAATMECWFTADSVSGENPTILTTAQDDNPVYGAGYLGALDIYNPDVRPDLGYLISFFMLGHTASANINAFDGNYHHVAGVWDGSQIRLYYDGVPVAATNAGAGPVEADCYVRLAYENSNDGCFLGGNVSAAGIYNRALSSNEVAASFNTDTVGDGIPNWWRTKYYGSGTTTDSSSCASCSPSGMSNLQAFLCGMPPSVTINAPSLVCPDSTNSASIPSLGTGVTYTWTVVNGSLLSGQYTPSITWVAGSAGTVALSVVMTKGTGCTNTASIGVPIGILLQFSQCGIVPCAIDSVGDEITDCWRAQYYGGSGTTTDRSSRASASPCGMSNLQAFQCGMPPCLTIIAPGSVCPGSTNSASVSPLAVGVTDTWTIVNGSLLSGQYTSNITWVAGDAGTSTLSVVMTRGADCVNTASVSVTIGNLSLDNTLPDGGLCQSYSGVIQASGGTGPYTYTKISGSLPTGLTLSSGGTITGTPTDLGTFTFTVLATDTSHCGSRVYDIIVTNGCPACVLTGTGTFTRSGCDIGAVGTYTGYLANPIPDGELGGGLLHRSDGNVGEIFIRVCSGTPYVYFNFYPKENQDLGFGFVCLDSNPGTLCLNYCPGSGLSFDANGCLTGTVTLTTGCGSGTARFELTITPSD